MRTTKELFGNPPRKFWKMRKRIAKKSIEFAKEMLNEEIDKPFELRDNHKEHTLIKAIKFWETIRDESKEEMK